MRPTADDFKPRQDGLWEHRARWSEIGVGTLLADPNFRSKIWEVVEMAHGVQVDYGRTLWMKVRERGTGEEHSIPPRLKTRWTSVLTNDPADKELPPSESAPSDTDEIMEAVGVLQDQAGGSVLAWRDETTGEVCAPDHAFLDGSATKWLIHHLRWAHGLEVADDADPNDLIPLHSTAHQPKTASGFAHRHVPEDLTFL